MIIQATIDKDLMEELRKYWKLVKKIDYRWIIEIKQAIESVVEAKDHSFYIKARMHIKELILNALKDFHMKRITNSDLKLRS